MGAMVACFIKLILPFIIVFPGIIAFVLFPNLESGDMALPALITEVIPKGLSGLIIAAVMASLMSSADSSLNSWAALFTHDFYYRLINKKATSKQLVFVGRLAVVIVLVASVTRTLLLKDTASILQFLLNGLAYISCPIIIIFAFGVFWKRTTSAAALITMLISPLICYFAQHMKELVGFGLTQTSVVYWLPIAVVMTCMITIVVSLITKGKTEAQLENLIWKRKDTLNFTEDLFDNREFGAQEKDTIKRHKLSIWKDYRLIGLIAMVLMCIIIWLLR